MSTAVEENAAVSCDEVQAPVVANESVPAVIEAHHLPEDAAEHLPSENAAGEHQSGNEAATTIGDAWNSQLVSQPLAPMSATAAVVVAAAQVPKRRIRMYHKFERLEHPSSINPGEPVPSVEGWTLLVANLPPATTVDDLIDTFTDVFTSSVDGATSPVRTTIHDVRVLLNRDCECIGHALIKVEDEEAAKYAVSVLHGKPLPALLQSRVDGDETERARQRNLPLFVSLAFVAEEEEKEERSEANDREKRPRD